MPLPALTVAERQQFLADVRIGLLTVDRHEGAPLAAPVWYAYRPGGEIVVVSGRDAEKTRLLRAGRPAAFTVQDEAPPSRFVTVDVEATVEEAVEESVRREIAERYVGDQVDAYLEATASADTVLLRLAIRRWRSVDFGKLVA